MVKASASDCDAELGALEKEKSSIELDAAKCDAATRVRESVAQDAKLELQLADKLLKATAVWHQRDSTETQGQDLIALLDPSADEVLSTGGGPELVALQVLVAEAELAAHEACSRLLTLEEEASRLRAEKKAVDERVPQLEALKKAAAASRSYKEAGSLAKEAKALSERATQLDATLDTLQEPALCAERDAASTKSQHEAAKNTLAERERDVSGPRPTDRPSMCIIPLGFENG